MASPDMLASWTTKVVCPGTFCQDARDIVN